jgi:hypothetical protein
MMYAPLLKHWKAKAAIRRRNPLLPLRKVPYLPLYLLLPRYLPLRLRQKLRRLYVMQQAGLYLTMQGLKSMSKQPPQKPPKRQYRPLRKPQRR